MLFDKTHIRLYFSHSMIQILKILLWFTQDTIYWMDHVAACLCRCIACNIPGFYGSLREWRVATERPAQDTLGRFPQSQDDGSLENAEAMAPILVPTWCMNESKKILCPTLKQLKQSKKRTCFIRFNVDFPLDFSYIFKLDHSPLWEIWSTWPWCVVGKKYLQSFGKIL